MDSLSNVFLDSYLNKQMYDVVSSPNVYTLVDGRIFTSVTLRKSEVTIWKSRHALSEEWIRNEKQFENRAENFEFVEAVNKCLNKVQEH